MKQLAIAQIVSYSTTVAVGFARALEVEVTWVMFLAAMIFILLVGVTVTVA